MLTSNLQGANTPATGARQWGCRELRNISLVSAGHLTVQPVLCGLTRVSESPGFTFLENSNFKHSSELVLIQLDWDTGTFTRAL